MLFAVPEHVKLTLAPRCSSRPATRPRRSSLPSSRVGTEHDRTWLTQQPLPRRSRTYVRCERSRNIHTAPEQNHAPPTLAPNVLLTTWRRTDTPSHAIFPTTAAAGLLSTLRNRTSWTHTVSTATMVADGRLSGTSVKHGDEATRGNTIRGRRNPQPSAGSPNSRDAGRRVLPAKHL